MSTIKEYFDYVKKYESKYGEKTIILMQVGSFFEVYGLKDLTSGDITGSAIVEFTQSCDFAISNKKTNGYFVEDKEYGVVMAGFPEWSSDKWFERLPSYGFTCIVIRQEKDGKNVTRDIDVILSPGTFFYESQKTLTNNIMSIKVYHRKPTLTHPNERIIIALSIIDVLTGENFFYEMEDEYIHNPSTFDTVEKYYSIFQPNELLMIYNPQSFTLSKIRDFVSFIGGAVDDTRFIEADPTLQKEFSKQVTSFEKQTVQFEWINQIFKPAEINGFLQSIMIHDKVLALENHSFLLNYVYTHNRDLLTSIKEPSLLTQHENLVLANHSLKQLNFVKDKGSRNMCVFDMINKSATPMGKRKCTKLLMNPTYNVTKLNFEYRTLREMEKNNFDISKFNNLKKIGDMAKNLRKFILQKYDPDIITQFYNDLTTTKELIETVKGDKTLCSYINKHTNSSVDKIYTNTNAILKFIDDSIYIDKCNKNIFYGFEENVFKDDYNEKLHKLFMKTQETFNELNSHINTLNIIINSRSKAKNKTPPVKLYYTEKQNIYLKCSNTKAKILGTAIKNDIDDNIRSIVIETATSSDKRINSLYIQKLLNSIKTSKDKIQEESNKTLQRFIHTFIEKQFQINAIIGFIENLDIITLKYGIKSQLNYCIPKIMKSETAFFDAKDLRHALIENIQTDIPYTPNDVALKNNGILLYGTNAVGKSSLIKSIGIAIILAQCGFPVPATTFKYRPFKELFTRILGNDDLFKGLSTFAVEMCELRTILKHASPDSLVLGDELCSGTEYGSAISIFSAGLEHLTKQQSTFIFATHFHEINEFDFIKNNERILIKHMAVKYDHKDDALIYDRKLKDGLGANMYGLEVCKSLRLPKEFLDNAFSIRNKYIEKNNIADSSVSSYNSSKLKHICELCGDEADDIHHLQYQQYADNNGFIKTLHKNHKSNLMSICKKCHNNIHKENKQFKRVKTTKGNKIIEV